MLPRCVRLAALALLSALPLAAGEDAADLAARKTRLSQEVREVAQVDIDLAATYHGLALLFDRLKGLSALVTLDKLTIRREELIERGTTITASFRLRIPLRAPAP